MLRGKGAPARLFEGLVLVGAFFVSSGVSADQTVCGDVPLLIKASAGQTVEVIVENGVGDLVRAGDPSTLKVEHASGHLFFTPFGTQPAEVTVIDMQGRSHLIRWSFDGPADRKVMIRDCTPDEVRSRPRDAVMGLMRDLMLGRTPAEAITEESDDVMFDDGKVRMRAVSVHRMPKLTGYVMRVENLISGPVIGPLQRISFPGLLAVSSPEDILGPGEAADLYMVVGP